MLYLVNNCWHCSKMKIDFLLLLVLEITHKWKLHERRSLEHYCSILEIKYCLQCNLSLMVCLSLDISHNTVDKNLEALLGKFRDMGYGSQIKRGIELENRCFLQL